MLTRAFKLIYQLMAGSRKIVILNYHQVLPAWDPMRPDEITRQQFEHQLAWISSCFNVLTLQEAVAKTLENNLPSRTLVITFDDGYQNNATIALPLLQKYDLKATFFIATDYLNGGLMWNDRIIEALRNTDTESVNLEWLGLGQQQLNTPETRQKLAYRVLDTVKHLSPEERSQAVSTLTESLTTPPELMMTSEEVRLLHSAGMEIGGHTCSHPILGNLNADDASREISANKDTLESMLDEQIYSFAYPNGKPHKDYTKSVLASVHRAGYQQAVTTAAGVASASCDRLQLPRYTPWRRDAAGFMTQLAQNYLTSSQQL